MTNNLDIQKQSDVKQIAHCLELLSFKNGYKIASCLLDEFETIEQLSEARLEDYPCKNLATPEVYALIQLSSLIAMRLIQRQNFNDSVAPTVNEVWH